MLEVVDVPRQLEAVNDVDGEEEEPDSKSSYKTSDLRRIRKKERHTRGEMIRGAHQVAGVKTPFMGRSTEKYYHHYHKKVLLSPKYGRVEIVRHMVPHPPQRGENNTRTWFPVSPPRSSMANKSLAMVFILFRDLKGYQKRQKGQERGKRESGAPSGV